MKRCFEAIQVSDAQTQKFTQIAWHIALWIERYEAGDEGCVKEVADPWGNFHDEYFIPEDLFENITIDDLKAVMTEGPHQGKSGLWLFAQAAAHSHIFLAAWKKWDLENHLTQADLRVAAEHGDDSGKTLLWLLLFSYSSFCNSKPHSFHLAPIWSLDK